MLLGDLITKLAKKSGIEATDKALIDILSKAELATADIPDSIANAIDTSLMNIDAAKANSEVIKKIKAETLNGADAMIEKLITEFGIDATKSADITSEKNTFLKFEKLTKLVKALEVEKAGADAGDKSKYTKQIEELNGQLREIKTAQQTEIKTLTEKHISELTNRELKMLIAAKKLSLPEDMPAELKNDIVLNAVKAELATKGFQIVNESNGSLSLKKVDGTDAYDSGNNKIALPQFIDGVLAQNKLLAVNEPAPPAGPATPIITGDKKDQINATALNNADQALADAGL